MRCSWISMAAVALLIGCMQTHQKSSGRASSTPAARLEATEGRLLASANVEQDFAISVALPYSYQSSEQAYPVAYVLDADLLFGVMAGISRLLPLDATFLEHQVVPELIVVGIGYPGGLEEMRDKRPRHLTPSDDPRAPGTGAFFRFLSEELVPYIESHYRVDPRDRILIGTSTAGLFVLDVLFQHPGFFHRYIAASPRPDPILFEREEAYAAAQTALAARLFLSAGTEGEIESFVAAGVDRLVAILQGRQYSGLDLHTASVSGGSHVSAQPIALTRGLEAIYSPVE